MQQYAAFIVLVLVYALLFWIIRISRKGMVYEIRRIAAFDVMEDAVKRCAELGRPVMVHLADVVTTATGSSAGGASYGMNKLSMASFLSRVAAGQEVPVEYTVDSPEAVAFLEDNINVACRAVGKSEQIPFQRIHYWGKYPSEQNWRRFSVDWNAGASVIVAGQGSDAAYLEGSRSVPGNFLIGGCSSGAQMGWYVPMCDYFMFPDEIMVMGAVLNKVPDQVNSLLIYDLLRIGFLVLLFVGVILSKSGVNIVGLLGA